MILRLIKPIIISWISYLLTHVLHLHKLYYLRSFQSWDDDLATMAQEWSDGCEFEHGNPTNISPFSSIGQNLWLGTGSESSPPDGTGQTQSWYNEVQYYTFSNMACSHVCGHYTQVRVLCSQFTA